MSFNLSTFSKSLESVFDQIEKDQSEAISIQVAANFIAGQTAAETHKSFNKLNIEPVTSSISFKSADPELEDPEVEEDGLTTEEKDEIALLVALYLGYLKGFNERAQAQILAEVEGMVKAGQTQEEIQKYMDDVFSGNVPIVIDNTGKTRKEIYVDKNLKLSEVEKVIEKPFYASVLTYAAMTAENAAHSAYEAGRKTTNIKNGFPDWVFVGPADERARAHHVAILGQVFRYGTSQSEYAERCLQEPRCRHRAVVYYNDPKKDTAPEKWQQLKDDAGLKWSDEKEEWVIE